MVSQDEKVREAARQLEAMLVSAERPDGTRYVRLIDGAPDWMRDAVREAHGGMLPDDWLYGCMPTFAETIADADDIEDAARDAADACVDTYDSDLLAYLGGGDRWERVDEAMAEHAPRTLGDAIRLAQYEEAQEAYARLVWALERVELIEDDEDDD